MKNPIAGYSWLGQLTKEQIRIALALDFPSFLRDAMPWAKEKGVTRDEIEELRNLGKDTVLSEAKTSDLVAILQNQAVKDAAIKRELNRRGLNYDLWEKIAASIDDVTIEVTVDEIFRLCRQAGVDDRSFYRSLSSTIEKAVNRWGEDHFARRSVSEPTGDFAADLRQLRKALGLTQTQAAAILGVPMRTYQSWEGDERIPAPYVRRMALITLQAEA